MVLQAELITFKIFQFILLAKLFNVFNTLEKWCDNAIAITTTHSILCVCVWLSTVIYWARERANERAIELAKTPIRAARVCLLVCIEVNESGVEHNTVEYEMDKYNI